MKNLTLDADKACVESLALGVDKTCVENLTLGPVLTVSTLWPEQLEEGVALVDERVSVDGSKARLGLPWVQPPVTGRSGVDAARSSSGCGEKRWHACHLP